MAKTAKLKKPFVSLLCAVFPPAVICGCTLCYMSIYQSPNAIIVFDGGAGEQS